MPYPHFITASFLSITLLCCVLQARQKQDVIHFKNGDVWTCEIKKLDRGYLYVSLDYVDGTVSVDWSKVRRVESPQLFVMLDEAGRIHRGGLRTRDLPEPQLAIGTADQSETLPFSQVAELGQTEAGFWQGVHGSVDAGLGYTKSNQQTQFNFNAEASYVREQWLGETQFHTTFTGSSSSAATARNDLQFYGIRFLRRTNYFAAGLADFLKSDEQNLNLRMTLGAGVGRSFRTSHSVSSLLGGIVWTRELYAAAANGTSSQRTDSAEAVLATNFNYFRFKTTNVKLDLRTYASLTDPGRFRSDGNATIKFQIIKDLYWNFNVYTNLDSRPPRNTSKSDYGVSSSLGWSF